MLIRSSAVSRGNTCASTSFARNADSYCPSPRPRSHAAQEEDGPRQMSRMLSASGPIVLLHACEMCYGCGGSARYAFVRRKVARRNSAMPQAKRNLKVKRPSKVVSVAGIAGAFLASSTSRSVANVLPQSMAPFQVLNLGEEEISDVTLATFHFVDGESPETPLPRVQLARGGCGGGCGGCGGRGGGCGGFRGCGGCAHGGCAGFRGCGGFRGCAGFRGCGRGCGFGGCGGCAWGWGCGWGGCCLSWGGCSFC